MEMIPAIADQEHRPPGRPRDVRTDEAIVKAALDLLREQGPGAVNVAAIAKRSGLARTTIYRRYRNRASLLAATLREVTVRGEPPQDRPIEEKLRWVIDRAAEVLEDGIGAGGVAAVLTGTDPEFSAVARRSLEEGLRPVRDEITADTKAGRLVGDVDADTLVGLVIGSHLASLLLHGSAPDERAQQRTLAVLRHLIVE